MKYILILTSFIFLTSCDAVIGWLDALDIEPIEQDTVCTPVLYTEPAFVAGCVYIDEPITTNVIIRVGSLIDSIENGDDMSSKLKTMLSTWHPEFQYQVYVADTDWRKVAFIAKGTNDHTLFNGKVFLRFNNMFSSRGFISARQAFIFNGALSFDEYQTALDSFPSYDIINWIGTNWDSTRYDNSARKAVECQIGRYYANFRFNKDINGVPIPIPQEIVDLYINAGWESVLH